MSQKQYLIQITLFAAAIISLFTPTTTFPTADGSTTSSANANIPTTADPLTDAITVTTTEPTTDMPSTEMSEPNSTKNVTKKPCTLKVRIVDAYNVEPIYIYVVVEAIKFDGSNVGPFMGMPIKGTPNHVWNRFAAHGTEYNLGKDCWKSVKVQVFNFVGSQEISINRNHPLPENCVSSSRQKTLPTKEGYVLFECECK